jgi:hypothetical protein
MILTAFNQPRPGSMASKESMISAVLNLTKPSDFVMDAKGEAVFRPRPFYYALEGITLRRLRRGLLKDDIPECLIATRTAVATLSRMPPRAHNFIKQNYIPVAYQTRVLGKILTDRPDTVPRTYTFDIVIPERYLIVSEKGDFSGSLDGAPAGVAQFLQPGPHHLEVERNDGRLALIWARAAEKKFSPFSNIPHDAASQQD